MKMKTNADFASKFGVILLLILLTGCAAPAAQPPTPRPTPRPTLTVAPELRATWIEKTETSILEAEVEEIIDETLPELASTTTRLRLDID